MAEDKKDGVDATQVNLGHVLALRPRVSKSFKHDDLREAKRRLEDERWDTVEEAARAVAERALELQRETGSKSKKGRRAR